MPFKMAWTITSSRRKKDTVTPAPRKRHRPSTTRNSFNPLSRDQGTLTQAQWMTPAASSFNDDAPLLESNRPRTLPATAKARSLKKRDSTLTQMDFFSSVPQHRDHMDDVLLSEVTNTQENHPGPSAQLDGNYSSPRKPRKRKDSLASSDQHKKPDSANLESQEYNPSNRQRSRRLADVDAGSSGRRVSSRLARKHRILSDPVENLAFFEEALGTPFKRGNSHRDSRPAVEIKDSLEEEDVMSTWSPVEAADVPVRTPTALRTIVLSSQSPESFPPSIRTAIRVGSVDQALRSPLAERSRNLSPGTPSKSSAKKQFTVPETKIVTLKLPKRKPPQSQPRVEDSQKNLWSLPSSSPQQTSHGNITTLSPFARPAGNLAEIPDSSQAEALTWTPPASNAEASLPSIRDIFGLNASLVSQHTLTELAVDEGGEEPVAQDFPAHSQSSVGIGNVNSPMKNMAMVADGSLRSTGVGENEMVQGSEDEWAGSPIEVQENELSVSNPPSFQRSPATLGRVRQPPGEVLVRDLEAIDGLTYQAEEGSHSMADVPKGSAIPQPRLVEKVMPLDANDASDQDRSLDDFALPPPPSVHRRNTQAITTRIPLNDIRGDETSSQSLPSAATVTQRSIYPATMPHPSQISTQDATQGLFGLSSFPRPTQYTQHGEGISHSLGLTDKITIKDSSSCQVSMSQIPEQPANHSQADIDLGLEEVFNSEDEGDLDLDPPATPAQRPSQVWSDIQISRTPSNEQDLAMNQANETHVDDLEKDVPRVEQAERGQLVRSSQISLSPILSSQPSPLKKQHPPLAGFDNDTQSNFTQNGHVTAAYIHRQREAGVLPDWYRSAPYKVPGYTRMK